MLWMVSSPSSPSGVEDIRLFILWSRTSISNGFLETRQPRQPKADRKGRQRPFAGATGCGLSQGNESPGPLPPPFEMSLPSQKAHIEGVAHRSTVPRYQHRVSMYAGGGVSAAVPRKSHRYTEPAPSYGGERVVPRNVSRRARYWHSRSLRVFPATLSKGPPQGIDEATGRPTQVR